MYEHDMKLKLATKSKYNCIQWISWKHFKTMCLETTI